MKAFRLIIAIVALTAFAISGVAFAADTFYVAKDVAGKIVVVDKAPADAKSIVKGPFKTIDEANQALADAEAAAK
jgi:hypothetical protein